MEAGISGPITGDEAAEINRSVAEVIRSAAEKEDRLLRKLRVVLALPRKKPGHCDATDEA